MIAKIKSMLMNNKRISSFLTKNTLAQFGKYLVTGVSSAGLEYGLLVTLTEFFSVYYIVSNSVAFFCGFWLSFLLNRYWSFKSKDNFIKQLSLYSMLFAINFVLTNSLLYFLTSVLGIIYMISKIFVMGAVVLWNFVIYKKIIYR